MCDTKETTYFISIVANENACKENVAFSVNTTTIISTNSIKIVVVIPKIPFVKITELITGTYISIVVSKPMKTTCNRRPSDLQRCKERWTLPFPISNETALNSFFTLLINACFLVWKCKLWHLRSECLIAASMEIGGVLHLDTSSVKNTRYVSYIISKSKCVLL